MKKSKLALLAALPAAIALVTAAANVQAAPEIYGKLNVSMQDNYAKDDSAGKTLDNWTLDSNASRIGVKGSTDLDGGLKGVYKLEYQAYVDNGQVSSTNTSTFSQRNIYLGVQGNFGTIIGGKFDTPTKESQGKVDQFNDYILGDITNVIAGENRASNIVMYSTPKMGSVTVNVAIIPGENNGVTVGNGNNGPADGSSASVVYDTDSLYLAFAADNHVAQAVPTGTFTSVGGFAATEADVYRLTGQVKLDALSLGAILQRAKDVTTASTDERQDGIILSAAYTMNKETLKTEFGHSKLDKADSKLNSLSLGWDHSLSKDAKAYAYVTEIKGKDIATLGDTTERTLGIGLEQKF